MFSKKSVMVGLLLLHGSMIYADALDQFAGALKKAAGKKTGPPLPLKLMPDKALIEEFQKIDSEFSEKLANNLKLQYLLKHDNRIKLIFLDYKTVRDSLTDASLDVMARDYWKNKPNSALLDEFSKRMRNDDERKNILNEWPVEVRFPEEKLADDVKNFPEFKKKIDEVKEFSQDLSRTYVKGGYQSIKNLRELLLDPSTEYDTVRNNLTENELKVLHSAALTDEGRKKILIFTQNMFDLSKRKVMQNAWPFTEKIATFFDSLSNNDTDKKLKHFFSITPEGKEVIKHIEKLWKERLESITKNKPTDLDGIKKETINEAVATLSPYIEYMSGSKATEAIKNKLLKDIKESDSFENISKKLVANPENYIKNMSEAVDLQRFMDGVLKADSRESLIEAFEKLDTDFTVLLKKPQNSQFVALLLSDKVWRRAFAVVANLRDEDVLKTFNKDLKISNVKERKLNDLHGMLAKHPTDDVYIKKIVALNNELLNG